MVVWNYHLRNSIEVQFYSAVENMTLGKKSRQNMGHYSFIKQIVPYSPYLVNTMVDSENVELKNP